MPWTYALLLVAVILFAAATAYGFFKLRHESATARYNSQAAVWLVVSFEREYLKFNSMLLRYSAQDPDLKADELLTQFDVLWSRIELMQQGENSRPLHQVASYQYAVPVTFQLIGDYEVQIFEAAPAGLPLPQGFIEAFRALADPIHRFMVDVHINRSWVVDVREAQIKDTRLAIYVTLAGTLVSTLMLFAIVLVQLKARHSNLIQTTAALEQSEEDRNALHQEVQRRELLEQEREALMVDLEERNEELERYAYTISHDLKSPLYTIQGFTGFLERDIGKGNPESMLNDLAKIREAVLTMANLLDDILKLSRLDTVTDEVKPVSLDEVIEQAQSMLSIEIEESGVEIRLETDQPIVAAQPQRLTEVFQNLISNAVKFMGDQQQPVIEIGARSEGDWVHCHVRDNGSGIAPEYQDRVFNLFERLESGIQGTGVGLAIVKRVIERHGGRVWIVSDGEGQGCSFEFTLRAAL
jgi:signal transduction histidine kinase